MQRSHYHWCNVITLWGLSEQVQDDFIQSHFNLHFVLISSLVQERHLVSLQPQIDEDVDSSACWLCLLSLRSSAFSLLYTRMFSDLSVKSVMRHRQNNKWQKKKKLWVSQHHSYWSVVLTTLYALTCVKKSWHQSMNLCFQTPFCFSNDNSHSAPCTLVLVSARYNIKICKSWAALRKGQFVFHHASYCMF